MNFTKASLALGIGLLMGACAGAQQKPAQVNVANLDCRGVSADAVDQLASVKKVETLYRTEFRARAIQPRFVSGAALHVPAQPGISAAYLERALSCHAAQTASNDGRPNPLRVAGVEKVQVRESGAMMRVAITSHDTNAAKEIVKQAKALQNAQGDVSVQQLSAAVGQRTAL